MIDKKHIIKIAKHAFKRSQGIPDRKLIHPRREWALGILFFAAILIGGSFLSALSFAEFRNITTEGGEAGIAVPRYNESLISQAIDFYKQKQAVFNSLTNNSSAVIEVPELVASSTPEVAVASSTLVSDTETAEIEAEAKDEPEVPESEPVTEAEFEAPVTFQ